MFAGLRRLITFLLIITAPLWISSGLWHLKPIMPLKLSLVDYTVPYDNYAEHSASIWAFNHLRLAPPPMKLPLVRSETDLKMTKEVEQLAKKLGYTKKEPVQNETKEAWSSEDAYIGPEPFKPYIQHRLEATYPLDQLTTGRPLPYDFIYIADTYGVYREDFTTSIEKDGEIITVSASSDPEMLKHLFEQGQLDVHMDYSKLLFGGLSEKDIEVLEKHGDAGGDIFFEFNAFCDPTSPNIRTRAEAIAGVKWTGWSGRFLPNPQDKDDAPHWLERQYIQQFPNKKLPSVPSLLLAHRDGRVFLIESNEDMVEVLPTLHLKDAYLDRFPMANTPYYYFWFAIMKPDLKADTKVLAEIHLSAPKGKEGLYDLLDIPQKIPLLTERTVGKSHRYHFAIDGSDLREDLGNYPYAGLDILNSLSPKNRGNSINQRQVFWQFYLPMLKVILWERSVARYPDFPPPLWQRFRQLF